MNRSLGIAQSENLMSDQFQIFLSPDNTQNSLASWLPKRELKRLSKEKALLNKSEKTKLKAIHLKEKEGLT